MRHSYFTISRCHIGNMLRSQGINWKAALKYIKLYWKTLKRKRSPIGLFAEHPKRHGPQLGDEEAELQQRHRSTTLITRMRRHSMWFRLKRRAHAREQNNRLTESPPPPPSPPPPSLSTLTSWTVASLLKLGRQTLVRHIPWRPRHCQRQ